MIELFEMRNNHCAIASIDYFYNTYLIHEIKKDVFEEPLSLYIVDSHLFCIIVNWQGLE